VRAAVLVEAGQGLEQGREVPGQQRGPHPYGVDRGVSRGQVTQGSAELGLADPVLDVGAASEPGLDVQDTLAATGGVVGGDEGGR
jgi:hypothetical protein